MTFPLIDLTVQSRHLLGSSYVEPFGFDCPVFEDNRVGYAAGGPLQFSRKVLDADEAGEAAPRVRGTRVNTAWIFASLLSVP
jgi:hypothetical protein